MKEYEYSFKVSSLDPYIKYLENNNYILETISNQKREIYRNKNKTIARITTDKINNKVKTTLDFKEDILNNKVLIKREESLPLEFASRDSVESILNFLNYKKDNTLIRKRSVYLKDDVKFEIDEYVSPSTEKVIAIEGNKLKVDKIYNKIKNIEVNN